MTKQSSTRGSESAWGGGEMYGYGVLGLIVTILVIILLLRLLGLV